MPELIGYAIAGTTIAAAALYFFKVYLPGLLDTEKDVDLEEAKALALAHKKEVTAQQQEVKKEAEAVVEAVAEIAEEAAKDKVNTEVKIKEVNNSTTSVREYLEGEGFDVEEIYPE